MFGFLGGSTFGHTIFQNAVGVGLNFAVTKGLDGLGINPAVTNVISAFVSGGTLGGFNSGFTAQNFIQNGIKAMDIEGTQILLQRVGLDTNLSSAISFASGQFVDGIVQGNLGGQIVKIGQALSTNLSLYGLEKIGTSIGLSPTVAMAFSAPISLTIGQGLTRGNIDGEQIIRSVQDGLYNGAVRYGLDFAIDKMGIDNTLLRGLASTAITTSISSLLDPNGNLVRDVLAKASSQVISTLNLISTPDFSRLVQQQGISKALEITATSVFSRSAQEDIIKAGGIAQIISGRAQLVNIDGTTLRKININSNESFYLDSHDNLVALQRSNGTSSEIYSGNFSITDKGAKLLDGVMGTIHADGSVSTIEVRDGKTYQIVVSKTPGTSNIATQTGPEGQTWITFDIQPDQTDLVIKPNETDVLNIDNVTIMDGSLIYKGLGVQIDVANGYGTSMSMDNTSGASSSGTSPNTTTLFALVNGILNKESDPTKSPDYINNFESDIAGSSNGQYVAGRDFMKSAIYQGLGIPVVSHGWDIANLFFEAMSPIVHLASTLKIIKDFDNRFKSIPTDITRPIIAMGYSGGFLPLVEAIQQRHYNTDTLIGLGAATTSFLNMPFENVSKIVNYVFLGQMSEAINTLAKYTAAIKDISQLGVKRAVNVWGTNDILYQLGIAGKRDSIGGINTYNIEIAGASHFDYMRRLDETDPVKAAFNVKVSQFVTDLTLASNDDAKLLVFLKRTMTAPDADGVWRFHP